MLWVGCVCGDAALKYPIDGQRDCKEHVATCQAAPALAAGACQPAARGLPCFRACATARPACGVAGAGLQAETLLCRDGHPLSGRLVASHQGRRAPLRPQPVTGSPLLPQATWSPRPGRHAAATRCASAATRSTLWMRCRWTRTPWSTSCASTRRRARAPAPLPASVQCP